MKCGDNISNSYDDNDIDTALLTCCECEHIFRCAECGERISIDDMIIAPNGSKVCSYCYEENFKECSICGEVVHEGDTLELYLARSEDDITSYHITVCDSCVHSDKFKKLFGEKITVTPSWWHSKEIVLLDNITLEGLNCFDIWHFNDDYEKFKSQIEARTKDKI